MGSYKLEWAQVPSAAMKALPGPPVLSTLVAEIYGPDFEARVAIAREVRKTFESTPGVVDTDWLVQAPAPRLEVEIDREKAVRSGVTPEVIVRTLRVALDGAEAGLLHDDTARLPVPLVLRFDRTQRSSVEDLLAMTVPSSTGRLVPLRELVHLRETSREKFIFHKNLRVTPLIIMAPIPLTLIGILPAHGLGGVFFTATSMIGFIALAGIIVRNSILLVDFINLELAAGEPLEDAVVKAGAVRFRPIALTAAALVVGGFVILLDPIFQGLAVSLISGVVVSTVLTLVIIPLLYFMYLGTVGTEALVAQQRPAPEGE